MEGPEYFPETFPPEGFPRFDWTRHPEDLPKDVWTTETTHRDGQQGGLPFDVDFGLKVFDVISRFTGQSGAIRQAEFFVYHPSDRSMIEAAVERWKDGGPIEPTSWIRAARKDVELVKSIGIRETGMLASISDFHTFHKFKPGGRRQATETYLEAVHAVLEAGLKPRLHLEDATRAPIDLILSFVEACLEAASSYGEDQRPRFRVCDTMGIGLPFEDVDLPRSVPRIFQAIKGQGLRPEDLEFHPHNDTWLVVANCLAAVTAGCGVINGCSLGKGERTGNAPLEAVLMQLIGMGFFAREKPDFTALNELAELYAERGEELSPRYPLFGRDAHRTRAGIHADGLNKLSSMYAPFDVPKLLGRPLEVSITKDSGLAGIVFLARQHLGVELDKSDPVVQEVHEWVMQQFDQGREVAIEWDELAAHFSRSMQS
jgi:isopropylmalate/homocitrate/citramalate synthase